MNSHTKYINANSQNQVNSTENNQQIQNNREKKSHKPENEKPKKKRKLKMIKRGKEHLMGKHAAVRVESREKISADDIFLY